MGRDFLPRGTGIVTRRPLVLQLYNTAFLRGEGDERVSDGLDWKAGASCVSRLMTHAEPLLLDLLLLDLLLDLLLLPGAEGPRCAG